jgi:hypothetical protein
MSAGFWTAEKDRILQKLEAAGHTARQIGARLGATRSAVIARSARLRGVVFRCEVERQKREKAQQMARHRERKRRIEAALAAMRRGVASGMERNAAIALAVEARATYQAVADALGLTRQRIHQIVSRDPRAPKRPRGRPRART